MKLFRSAFAACLALAATGAIAQTREPAFAGPWVKTQEAQVRLVVAPVKDAKPGVWQSAGIEIQLDREAKTYWRSPGDTGVPPSADFTAAKGVRDLTLQFPAPVAFDDGAGGKAIGYRESVILPLWYKLAPPAPTQVSSGGWFSRPAPPPPPVKPALALTIQFGVCIKNLCMPAQASLELEVGAGVLEAGLGDRLLAARYRVPSSKTLGAEGPIAVSAVTVRRKGEEVEYEVATRVGGEGGSAALFIEAKDGLIGSMQGAPIGGSALFRARTRASAGDKLGPGRITLVTGSHAIEVSLDLDAIAIRP